MNTQITATEKDFQFPVPYEGEEKYIFISYSHDDQDIVLPIIQKLCGDGFRTWYDRGIHPVVKYDNEISNRIENCSLFIAFFSRNYFTSEYCEDEVLYARRLEKRVLKVHLEDTETSRPSSYDMRLGKYQDIYFYKYSIPEDFFKELYKTERFDECEDNISLEGVAAKDFFLRLGNDEVTDTESKKITRLDLSHNWIKRIPPTIGKLTNLQELNLSSNTLKTLPEEFCQLNSLRELDLSSNSFREFPSILISLPKLFRLSLGGNFLKTIPADIGVFEHLERLDLYRNWFEFIPPQIGDLIGLKNLDMSYNMFQFLPIEFCNLRCLETLDLNSTDLKFLPEEISLLDHLTTLDISYNVLEKPLPYSAIVKWFERGVFFEQEETNFDLIMSISGINLFETEIADFSKKILLTNNIDKITDYYKLLELI